MRASMVVVTITFGMAQAASPTIKTLYSFMGSAGNDGASPAAPLAIGNRGVLYGTTVNGGALDLGTVFALTPPTSPGAPWTESVLLSFAGFNFGAEPRAGLLIGPYRALYGTVYGGDHSAVFSLEPPASPSGAWIETMLLNFSGGDGGGGPMGGLVSKDGVLYGTTSYGSNTRTAFSLTPPPAPGGVWSETVLQGLGSPYAGLVMDPRGALYGTANGDEGTPFGTVFSLTPPAVPGGPWRYAGLYTFSGLADGGTPSLGPLVVGSGGVLYGTTVAYGQYQSGTIFSLTPPASQGGAWTEAVLYSFNFVSGTQPTGGLLLDEKSGVLYGTTSEDGGEEGQGTVFELAPPKVPGGGWQYRVLYRFTGGANGANPGAGLVTSGGGILYGTTQSGGAFGYGTVFAMTL